MTMRIEGKRFYENLDDLKTFDKVLLRGLDALLREPIGKSMPLSASTIAGIQMRAMTLNDKRKVRLSIPELLDRTEMAAVAHYGRDKAAEVKGLVDILRSDSDY